MGSTPFNMVITTSAVGITNPSTCSTTWPGGCRLAAIASFFLAMSLWERGSPEALMLAVSQPMIGFLVYNSNPADLHGRAARCHGFFLAATAMMSGAGGARSFLPCRVPILILLPISTRR